MSTETQFPYKLADLDGWVVRRRDGTVVRYTLTNPTPNKAATGLATALPPRTYTSPNYYSGSLGRWCDHVPAALPVYEDEESGLSLYIADAVGARKHAAAFDVIIDGGKAFGSVASNVTYPKIGGDAAATDLLTKFIPGPAKQPYRLISIDWDDRAAPPLLPNAWFALTSMLKEDAKKAGGLKVLTVCQGGHGRSGTALTSIMMCLTDYTPLDAIAHLRAIHCPRAIESVVQHGYLNSVADSLGREKDAMDADAVQDFRTHFLTKVTSEYAKPYQDRLRQSSKETDDVARDDD